MARLIQVMARARGEGGDLEVKCMGENPYWVCHGERQVWRANEGQVNEV